MYVQFVKFRSGLTESQVRETMEQRAPEFRAIPSLVQKFYVREPETGEYGGIYIWESKEAMEAYRGSELARSIPAAYQVEGVPRIELFELVFPLRGSAAREAA